MAWSEARLHAWWNARPRPSAMAGTRGNDAAVLRAVAGRTVHCTDQTIEGVHFDRGTRARAVGHKAAARAISDLAASAALPRALLLAVTAPAETSEAWLRGLLEAVDGTGRESGAPLVGGDLALAEGGVRIAVSAYGEFPDLGRPPARDRARAGHVVVATGAFGGSRLGRHLRIEPRVLEGRALRVAGARAMIDVSDGLWRDLGRLADASGVAIELEHVPVHDDAVRLARRDGRPAVWHALADGEDHELVATLPARAARTLLEEAGDSFVRIGRVVAGQGVSVVDDSLRSALASAPEPLGWSHGER